MPAAIPFPLSSTPGSRPGEGAGRLINCFAFKDGDAVLYGPVPGLTPFALTGLGPRGSLLVGATLYVAVTDALLKVTADGVVTNVGPLQGSGLVTMARDNRAPSPDIVIVTENGAFVTDGASVSDYPDADVGSPNSVSFLDAYFLFTYGNATIRASGINDTGINDQSFTKAEAKPDGLLRGIVKGRQFIALGQASTEFYDNAGLIPFPLQRSEVVDVGLFGPWAVAGTDDGWDKPWLMVASDGTVRRWDGYAPTIVSTRDVERSIATVADPDTLEAMVTTYGGNSVWSLSGPDFTWDYHINAGQWFERESYGLKRWRGRTSVKAFGKWLVGDIQSATLMALDEAARTEGASPLVVTAEGWLKSYPAGFRVNDLYLQFSTGQGREDGKAPIETDPRVSVSWSLDGGGRWGQPLLRSMGRQGQYGRNVRVGQLGLARTSGVKVRWSISDPVPFAFMGGTLPKPSERRP